jgi:hypothetical protein
MDRSSNRKARLNNTPPERPADFDPSSESLSVSPKLQQLRDWLEELSWRTYIGSKMTKIPHRRRGPDDDTN